jgi:hypothetical protein
VSTPRTASKNGGNDTKVPVPRHKLQITNQQKASLTARPGCQGKETPEEVPVMRIESPPPTMSMLPKQVSRIAREKTGSYGNSKNLIHNSEKSSNESNVNTTRTASKNGVNDKKAAHSKRKWRMAPNLHLDYNKQIKQDGEMQSIKKGNQDGAESATALEQTDQKRWNIRDVVNIRTLEYEQNRMCFLR